MKLFYYIFLFLSVFTIKNTFANLPQSEPKKTIITFSGLTDDYEFKFTDAKGKEIVFQEISEDVDVYLDDELIGKKYEIIFEEDKVEEIDEDGNSTGAILIIRRIISIKEI